MKVHLIKKQTIQTYVQKNARSKSSFENWINKIDYADWSDPVDIKSTFPNVDFLGGGTKRVIFNIGGNEYRLICSYNFGKKFVHLFVLWIGTHAEYNELCKDHRQFSINKY